MINLLRADIYRVFRTRGYWILQSIAAFFYFIEFIDRPYREGAKSVASMIQKGSLVGNELLFITLPLVAFILAVDFSKGTLKNNITIGLSRTQYFWAKMVTFGVFLLLQILFCNACSLLAFSIFGGIGNITTAHVMKLLYLIFVAWMMEMGTAVITFVIFTVSKSLALTISSSIVLTMGLFMYHVMNHADYMNYIDFVSGYAHATSTSFAHPGAVQPALIGAAAVIVLGSAVCDYLVGHQDL